LLTGLYILLALISSFFKLSKAEDLLDQFSRFFYQMEEICLNVISLDQFFADSSRDVAMATNFGQNWQTGLHLATWHFETDWDITIWISD